MTPRRRRLLRALLLLLVAALVAGTLVLRHAWSIYRDAPDLPAALAGRLGHGRIDDRRGVTLRHFPNRAGFIGRDARLADLPPFVPLAFLAAEDRRFHRHAGIDPLAVLRAAAQNLFARRVRSGASTITQQVIRRIFPRDRSGGAKFRESVYALKLERRLPKERILEAYLNLVPMGGEIEGVDLAARVYFGKGPRELTLSEAACLAALPKAPSRYLPRTPRALGRLRARRDAILARMGALGFAGPDAVADALAAGIRFDAFRPDEPPSHLVDFLVAREGRPTGPLPTAADARIQALASGTLAAHRERLARLGIRQAACVVVDARDATLAAMAGSLAYGPQDAGYVNGALAPRSAGSILKPFLYATALEAGRDAASLVADTVERYRTPVGDYLPLNATRDAYGPVTLRTALGNSLNLSAVRLIRTLGGGAFLSRLARVRLARDDRASRDRYGLGIAIGNVEVTLLSLAEAYALFPAGGLHRPLAWTPGPPRAETRVFDPRVAWLVSDILADPTARLLTFGTPSFYDVGYPVALKTGTSTRSRDAWLVSWNPRHVIALWAGNFDGAPTAGAGGATALGPVLRDLLRRLYPAAGPGALARPDGIVEREVCGLSGMIPSPGCPSVTREFFLAEREPAAVCTFHAGGGTRHALDASYLEWNLERALVASPGNFAVAGAGAPVAGGLGDDGMPPRIVSPRDGDRYVVDPFGRNEIRLQAETRTAHAELVWFVDGAEVGRTGPPYRMLWRLSRGRHVIAVAAPSRARSAVTISVE